MLLSYLERVLILQLLPSENNVVDLRIIVNLKQKLAASEEELKTYNIRQVGTNITWDKNFDTEIEMGDRAKEIIKEQLIEWDKEKKLTENYLPIYDKFIDPPAQSN